MTTTHTPGPYYITEYKDECEIDIGRKWDKEVDPANIHTFGSSNGALIATVKFGPGNSCASRDQAMANANLLAAAPDLLQVSKAAKILINSLVVNSHPKTGAVEFTHINIEKAEALFKNLVEAINATEQKV